ncbi:GDP-mannose 4,6-dehydratase [Brachyspira hyodysenteriae]|uniref:GDP-mannose 4,6-dehydratase n=1 Tax=Brachyspira hyodysenteriae TaxID=159 RepID=UPI0022CD697A|nr:GDP-mannose 4,6-dehydratase [Brachyspira hyodysenteriae]MDA0016427.1 GDP-mannose 4,6-dehydratase [Brachyspira hyodysenteriae]
MVPRDYTYIEDIVSGIISAIEYNKTNYEIINLGGGEPINLERMIKTIETVLGKKAIINRMEMQKGDVDKTVADITKARNLLNYTPSTSFENGIKKFVDWYIKK